MKTYVRILSVLCLLSYSGCKNVENATLPKADLILINGKVATENEGRFAQAFAVKDGEFIEVGSNDVVMAYNGMDTELIDARSATVIPGLNDSHTHLIRQGLNYNLELRWDGVKSIKQAMEMLKEQAGRTPDGQWIRVVGGWGEFQFEEKRLPTLQEVNEAVPDKPVYILYLYSLGYLNRKGLETLNYSAATKFPGGQLEMENGVPTGLLIAKPSALVLYKTLTLLPKLSREDQQNSSVQYFRELNSLGITSAIDAGGGGQYYPDNYSVTEELAAKGELTVRISYDLFAVDKGSELEFYNRWTEKLVPLSNGNLLKPNSYVFHGAGENLTWEAADFENFMEPRPELGEKMEVELERIVSLLAKNQWPFRIHATYNESISRFLDVFEKVDKEQPFLNKVRWFIDHAETIDTRNLERIKHMGGGIAVQDRMLFQGEYFSERYGREATLTAPPLSKIIDYKIPLGLGTDGTRVSSYNPMLSLYWAVSGKTLGGTQLYEMENLLSRHQALVLMTNGSAWFSQEEKLKGFIRKGMFADFAVLSDDYFTIDQEAIKSLTSDLTVVNGEIVFAKGQFSELDPGAPEVLPEWSPVKHFGGYQN